MNKEGFAHIMNYVMNSYDVRVSTPVKVPVFMTQCIHDYIVPYKLWDDYMDVFSDLTLKVFEKCGHTPQLEEQELFDKLLLEWISIH
jgi:proline iminopeptidase